MERNSALIYLSYGIGILVVAYLVDSAIAAYIALVCLSLAAEGVHEAFKVDRLFERMGKMAEILVTKRFEGNVA